ncbi:MAG TPA: hypothetical protein VJ603_05125 [Paucimonas sp.]|nr:hypothetical protein [Paucimonas sp.]HJW57693.1 hypothetical protein [Burkholderiaceae bacterium]
MWLLMLEAGAALSILVFIVWWTMSSGNKPTHRPPKNTPSAKEEDAR